MPFITPNNLPTGLFCRQILIPNDPHWIGLVSGALLPYTYPSEWEQRGGITAEQAASRWLEMLNQYWMSQCEGDDGMPCEGGCPEVLRRINPDTLAMEISTDGGSTWQNDPQSPMAGVFAQPPPVPAGISSTKCDAATNGKQHIEDLIAGCSNNLETAISVFDLAVAVCTIILDIVISLLSGGALAAAATALAAAIWGAAHAAFELGKTAFDANWTTDERDKILCALFCNIGEDGSFTLAGYNGFLAKWQADATPGPAFNFVFSTVKAVGLKGLNNMCAYGEAADADCSSCDCGCDVTLWDLSYTGNRKFGKVDDIDPGAGTLTVSTDLVNDDGHFYIDIRTPAADNCCVVDHIEIISGSYSQDAWQLCGSEFDPGGLSAGSLGAQCINHYQSRGDAPYTLKLFFIDC